MNSFFRLLSAPGVGSAFDAAEAVIRQFEDRALSFDEAMEHLALACGGDAALYFYEHELGAAADLLGRHPDV